MESRITVKTPPYRVCPDVAAYAHDAQTPARVSGRDEQPATHRRLPTLRRTPPRDVRRSPPIRHLYPVPRRSFPDLAKSRSRTRHGHSTHSHPPHDGTTAISVAPQSTPRRNPKPLGTGTEPAAAPARRPRPFLVDRLIPSLSVHSQPQAQKYRSAGSTSRPIPHGILSGSPPAAPRVQQLFHHDELRHPAHRPFQPLQTLRPDQGRTALPRPEHVQRTSTATPRTQHQQNHILRRLHRASRAASRTSRLTRCT